MEPEMKKDDDEDDLDKYVDCWNCCRLRTKIVFLDRLRQAAIRSSETKRTISNLKDEVGSNCDEKLDEPSQDADPREEKQQNFANFDQFKKYKQKMRDEGRADQSLIVSIPNISG